MNQEYLRFEMGDDEYEELQEADRLFRGTQR